MRFVRQALQNQLLCSSTIIMSRDVLFFSWYIKIVCALIVSKVLSLPKNSSKFSLFDFLPCSSSLDAGKIRQDEHVTGGFLNGFSGGWLFGSGFRVKIVFYSGFQKLSFRSIE